MTWTRPWRRMTLQCSQIVLTLGWTFIGASRLVVDRSPGWRGRLLVAVGDSATGQVVGGELDLYPISGKDPDVVHAHFPRDVREYLVSVLQLNTEHRVFLRFEHGAFEDDGVFFGLRQGKFS